MYSEYCSLFLLPSSFRSWPNHLIQVLIFPHRIDSRAVLPPICIDIPAQHPPDVPPMLPSSVLHCTWPRSLRSHSSQGIQAMPQSPHARNKKKWALRVDIIVVCFSLRTGKVYFGPFTWVIITVMEEHLRQQRGSSRGWEWGGNLCVHVRGTKSSWVMKQGWDLKRKVLLFWWFFFLKYMF